MQEMQEKKPGFSEETGFLRNKKLGFLEKPSFCCF